MSEQNTGDIYKRSATRSLRYRVMDGVHSRLAALKRPATGFVSAPEPRTIGRFARGRQMLAGNFLFAGHLIEADGKQTNIWNLPVPSNEFRMDLHGFAWLDDLAAVGDGEARSAAQFWLGDWISRFHGGSGPGWVPDITGRRLIRWINHALFLLAGDGSQMAGSYFQSLAHQTTFLARRWHTTAPGLPRFEALTGVIYAGLSLQGMEQHVTPAMLALERECKGQIDPTGGIASRNPEELLEIFTLLTWAKAALVESDNVPLKEHLAAIERIAPTLRALRHSDGGLARFHGGGRGLDGRLDQALAAGGVIAPATDGPVMGYVRMSGGRSSIIVDVAMPPPGQATSQAHASTLAFELTSGRRPLIVNCGPGGTFGEEWRRAGRATQLHSTLGIDGYSSSLLGARKSGPIWQEVLVETPRNLSSRYLLEETAGTLLASHDGYCRTHGLTHLRYMELGLDGRGLIGLDTLSASTEADQRCYDLAMDRAEVDGLPYTIRFHLHPEVESQLDMGGTAVSLMPRSGEVWVFRSSDAVISIEPSVYLEKGRLKPRPTKQIVLSGLALGYETEIGWTLAKAQEIPGPVRDLTRDDTLTVDR